MVGVKYRHLTECQPFPWAMMESLLLILTGELGKSLLHVLVACLTLRVFLKNLRPVTTLKIRTRSMNLFVSDACRQKVLSEQLTLKITTEASDCKNGRG